MNNRCFFNYTDLLSCPTWWQGRGGGAADPGGTRWWLFLGGTRDKHDVVFPLVGRVKGTRACGLHVENIPPLPLNQNMVEYLQKKIWPWGCCLIIPFHEVVVFHASIFPLPSQTIQRERIFVLLKNNASSHKPICSHTAPQFSSCPFAY